MCRILTGTLDVNMAGCDNVVVWNIYVFKLWDDKFDIFTAYSGTLVSLSWQPPTYPGDSFIMTTQGRIYCRHFMLLNFTLQLFSNWAASENSLKGLFILSTLNILIVSAFVPAFAPGLGADTRAVTRLNGAGGQTLNSHPFSSLLKDYGIFTEGRTEKLTQPS